MISFIKVRLFALVSTFIIAFAITFDPLLSIELSFAIVIVDTIMIVLFLWDA